MNEIKKISACLIVLGRVSSFLTTGFVSVYGFTVGQKHRNATLKLENCFPSQRTYFFILRYVFTQIDWEIV